MCLPVFTVTFINTISSVLRVTLVVQSIGWQLPWVQQIGFIVALILIRLDHCHMVFLCLLEVEQLFPSVISTLWSRLIFYIPLSSHMSSFLLHLHWLLTCAYILNSSYNRCLLFNWLSVAFRRHSFNICLQNSHVSSGHGSYTALIIKQLYLLSFSSLLWLVFVSSLLPSHAWY